MYITSECYGISRMMNIKCPLYTAIVIQDVILGVKKELACPSNTGESAIPPLNPICCRPSCNDCFQRTDTVTQEVMGKCNGLNYCDVQPKVGDFGRCDRNQTEYMAVAYNCQMASKTSDNTTALFNMDQDLCGRPPTIETEVQTTVIPNSTAASTKQSTITVTTISIAPNTTTNTAATTTTTATTSAKLPPPPSKTTSRFSSSPTPAKTSVPAAAGVSSQKTLPSTHPATQTTFLHRTPTKRFVPTSRMKISSTSTSSTRLVMSNRPEGDDQPVLGPLNKGAMIGGVAAAAGLLVFVLSLVMLRRRRRKHTPRLSSRARIYDDCSDDDHRAGQIVSPIEEVTTPTSLSEEGQTPWRFGPPDLNYATIHTEGRHIPANVRDITPLPEPYPQETATIRPIYAVVDRRLTAGPLHAGSQLYDEAEENAMNSSIQARSHATRECPPRITPVATLALKPKHTRPSHQNLWRQRQNAGPGHSAMLFSNTTSPR